MPKRESANSLNWYFLTLSDIGDREREAVSNCKKDIKKLVEPFPNLGESPGATVENKI